MAEEERIVVNVLKFHYYFGEFCLDEIRQLYFCNVLEDVVIICIAVQLSIQGSEMLYRHQLTKSFSTQTR